MRSRTPDSARSRDAIPRPFPTRGIPGGWRDAWDADPLDPVRAVLPRRDPQRRQVTEAELHVELLAQARDDGRWEAHVASGWPAGPWLSVNGPTAAVALDALEAELREAIQSTPG